MKQNKAYVFAGNRFHVLDEMLKRELNIVAIYAHRNSYLEKELINHKLPYKVICDKQSFIKEIESLSFDVFISNGLAVILPIRKLTTNNSRKFINIHPSYLPDLRGADPVPGAILHQRDSGVTCHIMNDKIDEGDIIAQTRIPMNSFLDAVLLYQMSFELERRVFIDALDRDFAEQKKQDPLQSAIYYSFNPSDLRIRFDESPSKIVARIKAFNNRSKGAFFVHKEKVLKVFDAEIFEHDCELWNSPANVADRSVMFIAEQQAIFWREDKWVRFKNIIGETSLIVKGDILR